VKPDVVCFGALMSCYQKAFRWQMVLEILKEMPRPNVSLGGSCRLWGYELNIIEHIEQM